MRNPTRILRFVLFAVTAFGRTLPVFADPADLQSTSAEPILPDPLPYTGPAFSAAAATAGTADPGPALESLRVDNRNCSVLNPCAMPSPALMTSGWKAPTSAPAQRKEKPARKSALRDGQGAAQH